MNKLAIVIIHYGLHSTTQKCLLELKKRDQGVKLILINNAKEDISDLVGIIPGTQLLDNRQNVGFARAVNQGIKVALDDRDVTHVMLMNNDLSFSFGSFAKLILTFTTSPQTGIVSPILHHGRSPGVYDWGGKFNKWTGMVKHVNWENKPKTTLSVDHVAGGAMLFSRALVDKIGLLDERFFLYYEDLDYCLRAARAGYEIRINPEVVAEHAVSAGSNLVARTMHQWRSHFLFLLKYLPVQVYPTALLFDLIFYPLILLKAGVKGVLHAR